MQCFYRPTNGFTNKQLTEASVVYKTIQSAMDSFTYNNFDLPDFCYSQSRQVIKVIHLEVFIY